MMEKFHLKENYLHKAFRRLFCGVAISFMMFFPSGVPMLYAGTDVGSTLNAEQQATALSGVVKDAMGEPLPGVSVFVKGTTI